MLKIFSIKRTLIILTILIIGYLSFILPAKAAYFNYAEFNFDEFAELNKRYWTHHCTTLNDNTAEERCVEITLERQRTYYTRLYSLLANYQRKGHLINDNIIIMTTFFELDPDMFTDDGELYNSIMGSNSGAYNWQDNDLVNFDINSNDNNLEFWENVEDDIQVLLKAMIAYPYTCYGSTGVAETVTLEDNTTVQTCPNGGNIMNGHCMTRATSGYMGWWEYVMSTNGVLRFFGMKSEEQKECQALSSEWNGYTEFMATPGGARVAEENYWTFLEESQYFDRKPHLQYRFARILSAQGLSQMSEVSDGDYEEFEEELRAVRRGIIRDIRALLENYGASNAMTLYTNASSDAYWWPVGSLDEIVDGNGLKYAVGDPISTTITSRFGYRVHPITKEYKMHSGVDLVGNSSEDNKFLIVASKSGVVQTVESSCSNGNGGCGGGYGNHIIILHADGNETLYAHLAPGSIIVEEGQSVNQGQIISRMGTTGRSTGVHLHFEVRVGGVAVDPLDYISQDNPRPASSATGSDLMTMLVCMEGTGPSDGDFYTVYDDKCPSRRSGAACGGTLTVGAGVTLKWQGYRFEAFGINPNEYMFIGARLPKDVVDTVKGQILNDMYDSVNSTLTSNGLSLQTNQIDALVSRNYNTGNISGFVDAYNRYGNAQGLYDNYMSRPVTMQGGGGAIIQGLVNRRQWEWNLFHEGIYHTC